MQINQKCLWPIPYQPISDPHHSQWSSLISNRPFSTWNFPWNGKISIRYQTPIFPNEGGGIATRNTKRIPIWILSVRVVGTGSENLLETHFWGFPTNTENRKRKPGDLADLDAFGCIVHLILIQETGAFETILCLTQLCHLAVFMVLSSQNGKSKKVQ